MASATRYLEALSTNYIECGSLIGTPDAAIDSIIQRNTEAGAGRAQVGIPAGVVIEVKEDVAKQLVTRGAADQRPHWKDVTKLVAADLTAKSPVDGESGGKSAHRGDPFTGIATPKQSEKLIAAGFTNIDLLASATVDELAAISGIGGATATNILATAKDIIEEREKVKGEKG